jgi:hypothetical protein
MPKYRLYVDESGDHGYRHADRISNRYLGLTGLLVEKKCYDSLFQPTLEQLKRVHFNYDIDDPPILVCNRIKGRKGCFWVLRDKEPNHKWEEGILNYFTSLLQHCQLFTVVIDKLEHHNKYPETSFDPYIYAFKVLLRRVKGYLSSRDWQADIIPESRGGNEDDDLKKAYKELRTIGDRWSKGEEYCTVFPLEPITTKKKSQNVAGLQIVDLIAYGQTLETIVNGNAPLPIKSIGKFTRRVNDAVRPMVNPYGQYFLV